MQLKRKRCLSLLTTGNRGWQATAISTPGVGDRHKR